MKIILNKELESFFKRCKENIANDYKNDFLGLEVDKESEKEIIKEMAKAGFAEFKEKDKPSLFLSTEEWNKTAYHKNIKLDKIEDNHFSYEYVTLNGFELFSIDSVIKDPSRELNDYLKLRAMDQDFESILLYQDDEVWMLDAPSEAITNNRPASKAKGNVITFGLGIGYFVYMALKNPNVSSVTVVERSEEVIKMFKNYILPQFETDKEVNIICGDAFEYWNDKTLDKYDYIYADIWKSNDDGLSLINKLLEQYNPEFDKTDFWIEDSCYEILWTLIFLYFDSIAHSTKLNLADSAKPYMKKISKYFEKMDIIVTKSDELKYYMYDTKTIREILGGSKNGI